MNLFENLQIMNEAYNIDEINKVKQKISNSLMYKIKDKDMLRLIITKIGITSLQNVIDSGFNFDDIKYSVCNKNDIILTDSNDNRVTIQVN